MNQRATKQLTKLPNPNCIRSTLLAASILIGIMLIQIGVAVHNQTSAAAASKSKGMESSKSQLHTGQLQQCKTPVSCQTTLLTLPQILSLTAST